MPPCDLVLETTARVFEREVSLLVKNDRRRREPPSTGRRPRGHRGGTRTPTRRLRRSSSTAHLPALGSATGRLVVDEGDNQPLPIGAPTVELRTYRLRFMRESPDEMWLVYGKAGLTAPRYDLALLDARLRASEAHEVTAEGERPASGPDRRPLASRLLGRPDRGRPGAAGRRGPAAGHAAGPLTGRRSPPRYCPRRPPCPGALAGLRGSISSRFAARYAHPATIVDILTTSFGCSRS